MSYDLNKRLKKTENLQHVSQCIIINQIDALSEIISTEQTKDEKNTFVLLALSKD